MSVEQAIQQFQGQPITRQILFDLLKDYKRPYDKINELVKNQTLLPIKRGIFIPATPTGLRQPEPFLLANHLLGPSYVSMETALSHWRLIPEQVFEISSVTLTRSKSYATPVGRFSFTHLPLPYFSFGQQQLEIADNQVILIATREKALCDKIVTTAGLLFRSTVQLMAWLMEDMRIEKHMLRSLDTNKMQDWLDDAPKRDSLRLLIKIIQEL